MRAQVARIVLLCVLPVGCAANTEERKAVAPAGCVEAIALISGAAHLYHAHHGQWPASKEELVAFCVDKGGKKCPGFDSWRTSPYIELTTLPDERLRIQIHSLQEDEYTKQWRCKASIIVNKPSLGDTLENP